MAQYRIDRDGKKALVHRTKTTPDAPAPQPAPPAPTTASADDKSGGKLTRKEG